MEYRPYLALSGDAAYAECQSRFSKQTSSGIYKNMTSSQHSSFEKAGRHLGKACSYIGKAADRYPTDEDLRNGKTYLASGLTHLQERNAEACTAAMKNAEPHLLAAKDRHPDDDDVSNAQAHHAAAMLHLSKIDYEGREPQGSDFEGREPGDATAPAKAALTREITKIANSLTRETERQFAFGRINKADTRVVGSALPPMCVMKAAETAMSYPQNVNGARNDIDNPTLPGKPLKWPDDGGGDVDVAEVRGRALRELGPNAPTAALSVMMAQLLRPQVLATRH